MNPTLLIDLDDTLLVNNSDTFLPAYLKAFSKEAAAYLDAKLFLNSLLTATNIMVKNQQPDYTLKETFDSAFFPALEVEPARLDGLIERFYQEVYPSLRSTTAQKPEAAQFIQEALARGYNLAIATNPLFPLTAIEQRLAWAGVDVETNRYAMVVSYESFHFAKPGSAFIAELLARLGWPEGPIVMIGDSMENDIESARQLGIAAYWITSEASGADNGGTVNTGSIIPTASGPLEQVLPWLDQVDPDTLLPDYRSPTALRSILLSTPAALDSLCDTLSAAAWTRQPQPGEWAPVEIVCHMRDVEAEVHLPRLRKVLEENNPFLPGKDTDLWAQERNYLAQDGKKALEEFIETRKETLALLRNLAPDDWQRVARHAILGPTLLAELVRISADHDRLHIRQLIQDIK